MSKDMDNKLSMRMGAPLITIFLQTPLLVVKLTGHTDLSWWWILIPVGIMLGPIAFSAAGLGFILLATKVLRWNLKRMEKGKSKIVKPGCKITPIHKMPRIRTGRP